MRIELTRRLRRRILLSVASLGAGALILGLSLTGTGAPADTGWKGGQYRDSRDPDLSRARSGASVTTRSTHEHIALSETAVQRPRLRPGDPATLRAFYSVPAPTEVRETRIIRYDGLVLARIERVVSRSGGSVQSEYRVDVPRDAAEGWYSVTTTVEPTRAATRGGPAEQKDTGFYVDTGGAGDLAKISSGPGAPGGEDAVAIKLSTNQTQYRVGDRVTFSFEANRDAFVTLVNVGTSGEVTILFPNRFSGGHGVKAGKSYRVPDAADSYELQIKGPPGVELVYVLVTLKPVIFISTDFPSGGGVFHSATERAASFTRDINAAAKSIPLREQAKAMIELEVTR
jgi:uncharacterized protein DUF4384